jgi:dGTPase
MQPYGGFEGNAQTMRLLSATLFAESRRGMNPTRAVLDAVCKYKTLLSETPAAENHYLYDDQAADLDFLLADQALPLELTPGTARNKFRSIECQIMDWADDTAYSINDLSDAMLCGFITIAKLESWATAQGLAGDDAAHVAFLIQAIADGKVESRLGRSIGDHISACSLRLRSNFLSGQTNRYKYELVVDDAVRSKAALNQRIASELVFKTPQLQQLDFKASQIMERLFEALEERYIGAPGKHGLHLLSPEVERSLSQAASAGERARLVCDWLANMTESFAIRTFRRLFDPGFGSFAELA